MSEKHGNMHREHDVSVFFQTSSKSSRSMFSFKNRLKIASLRIGKHRIVKNIASLRKVNIAHPYLHSHSQRIKTQNIWFEFVYFGSDSIIRLYNCSSPGHRWPADHQVLDLHSLWFSDHSTQVFARFLPIFPSKPIFSCYIQWTCFGRSQEKNVHKGHLWWGHKLG